jgi:selenium-binding protein 1
MVSLHLVRLIAPSIALVCGVAALFTPNSAAADETCNSPYMASLIKGQEDYVYVWTLGIEGLGDGRDKLVTVDVNPASPRYGKVIASVSVAERGEAHHMGFTDDRRYLWAGGLSSNKIYVFDVGADPARPKLTRTITDLGVKSGWLGPHTFYALPGRMIIGNLSNTRDQGGVTGMAVYNNRGDYVASYPMPTSNGGDGYGYDIAINPAKNAMLTSAFTGYRNYERPLGELIKDAEAMKNFGNTMVVWDVKAMQPRQVLPVPGGPLEIRWSLAPNDNWAITAAALTSKLWLVRQGKDGQWNAKEVATIGDPAKIPLPVDISITADGKGLWVNTFMDGKTRYFDLTNPEAPRQTYEKATGKQVNMISQSWDGKRVYITSSLLANWDKAGADNEQFLRGFTWDGKELKSAFEVDFTKEKLGRAHHMKLGSAKLKPALSYAPAATAPRLPPIQAAPDGEVLDDAGYFRTLAEYTHGRITLLGLVYTRCAAPEGCPRAAWAFKEVRSLLKSDPALRSRVRLVSLSFDPVHDVPEVLADYAARARSGGGGVDWHFLTTASMRRLAPILEGFGQGLGVATDSSDAPGAQDLAHNLKVFLLDPAGMVREIYSGAFLEPQAIVNDMRTLDAEQKIYSASASATGTQLQKRLRSP